MKSLPDFLQPQAAPGTWESVFGLMPAGGRVLNAGAGRGGISRLLHDAGYGVTSIDLHPDHFAAEGLECGYADLLQPLPFEAESFDTVIAVEVMEHLENPWLFFREAVRVLRPEGAFIFSSPNPANFASRLAFVSEGVFPYFREESFIGCYHVTPIFLWAVENCCRTVNAKIEKIAYSRVDWPRRNDVPRHDDGRGLRRRMLDLLPLNRLTGEIACYLVRKTERKAEVEVGVHYR